MEMRLLQGSSLSPFVFVMVMDRLTDEFRQTSLWTMMFADDIMIPSQRSEQMEINLESWRYTLERIGMKLNHSKTEYVCVNKRNPSRTVTSQGGKVEKVHEFKYC